MSTCLLHSIPGPSFIQVKKKALKSNNLLQTKETPLSKFFLMSTFEGNMDLLQS